MYEKLDELIKTLTVAEINAAAAYFQEAAGRLEKERRREARKALEEKARDLGYSLNELISDMPAKAARRGLTTGEAKYRNPMNEGETWTGRGRKPRWFSEALEAGLTPQEMEVV